MGWLYNRINPPDQQEAIRFLTAAQAIDPGRWQSWRKRAIVYSSFMKFDLAVADFSQAIRLNPRFAELRLSRAGVFTSQKQWNKSLEDLNQAIELDPALWGAFNNRGAVFEQLQQRELALADYSKAIELEPAARKPRENRGRLLVLRGAWDIAADDFGHLVNMPPVADFEYAEFAVYRLQAGDTKGYRDACALMRERVDEIKDNLVMACSCALACSLIPTAPGDSSFALQLAEWSLAKPADGDFIYRKIAQAAAWYRLDRTELAISQFQSIQKSWPDAQRTPKTASFGPLLSWLFLAQANQSLRRHEEAKRWLQMAEQRMHEEESAGAKMVLRTNRNLWPMCLILRRDAQKLLHGPEIKD